jgi:hypothetical protein
LRKKSPRKCCKRSHYVRRSKSTGSSKEAAYIFIAKNSINYYFNSAKVDFENKIIIQHLNAEPEMVAIS